MITVTSLKHPKTRQKIMKASYNVLHRGWSVDHVRSDNGRAFLAIRYIKETNRFYVVDGQGRDVTESVAQAI